MMKKALKFFLVIIFIAIFLNVFIIRVEATTRYVYDNADLFSLTEENELTQLALRNSTQHNGDFCFLTIDTCSMNPYEYARNFYYTHGFSNDGIIFVIFENEMYVETFGAFIDTLTNEQLQRVEAAGNLEINSACYEDSFVSAIKEFKKHNEPQNNTNVIDKKPLKNVGFLIPTFLSLCISCVVTIAIVCFFVFHHNAANKKLNAVAYLSHEKESFKVTDRTTIFVGDRQEICRGYYRERSSKR